MTWSLFLLAASGRDEEEDDEAAGERTDGTDKPDGGGSKSPARGKDSARDGDRASPAAGEKGGARRAGSTRGGSRPRTGGSRASEHRPHGAGADEADGQGAGGADDPEGEGRPDDQVAEARRKLEDAIRRSQESDSSGREVKPPSVGQKVDKYFGTKLPPVCARLGCYLTDDGKRFYCVNPSCQKHKKRATKHTRRAPRPGKGAKQAYFRCPQCGSRDVDLHMFASKYECRRCGRKWDRD